MLLWNIYLLRGTQPILRQDLKFIKFFGGGGGGVFVCVCVCVCVGSGVGEVLVC